MIIDSHHHFWRYDAERDNWITDEMAAIKKNFFPGNLQPLLAENNVDGCVSIQAAQTEAETNNLIWIADNYTYIKGVVGWINLRAENLEERLNHYKQYKKLKGFRHITEGEPTGFLLDPYFNAGIQLLTQYNFSYDILIRAGQLKEANEFVGLHPQQKFVLDHLAKPPVGNSNLSEWESGIWEIARQPNLYCKVSGLLSQADWQHWEAADFNHCLQVVTAAFGTGRLLWGTDWPLCNLGGNYAQAFKIVRDFYSKFPQEEQDAVMGNNALHFYGL